MFKQESIESAGLNWKDAEAFNIFLLNLKQGQVEKEIVLDDLASSKLAWKVTIYLQTLRYRLIEITDSCIDEWENERFVSCFIMARAIIETVSVLYDFERRLDKVLFKEDLSALDNLIMNRTFASRLANFFDKKIFYESISVLTSVDKLDKFLNGHIRESYDRLSEYAHPNYLGVFYSYAKIDYTCGDVSYGNQTNKYNVFTRLQGEFGLLEIANFIFEKNKSHIKKIVELQRN